MLFQHVLTSATQTLGSPYFTGAFLTLLGGVLAALLPGIGSARAVGRVGSVVSGVLSEDPEKFGKLIVVQALPGTQGIYGILVWFFVLIFGGFLGGSPAEISVLQGTMFFAACMPMALVGYFSALYQGGVAADGVSLVAKRPDQQSKALILAAMVETYAIFALLASVLSILFVANVK